jgi:hypothetical protein
VKFEKGQSGNPGGRPKSKELRDLCRTYTEEAVKELGKIALNAKSPTVRVMAIRELLDRGYGRPQQGLEVSIDDSYAEMRQPGYQRPLVPDEVAASLKQLLTDAEREMGLEPIPDQPEKERIERILSQPNPLPPALYEALHQVSGTRH